MAVKPEVYIYIYLNTNSGSAPVAFHAFVHLHQGCLQGHHFLLRPMLLLIHMIQIFGCPITVPVCNDSCTIISCVSEIQQKKPYEKLCESQIGNHHVVMSLFDHQLILILEPRTSSFLMIAKLTDTSLD